jgi:hypothetical protein
MTDKYKLKTIILDYIAVHGRKLTEDHIKEILYEPQPKGRPENSDKFQPYVLAVVIQTVCGVPKPEDGFKLNYPKGWVKKCIKVFKESRRFQPIEQIIKSETYRERGFDGAIHSDTALEKAFRRARVELDQRLKLVAEYYPKLVEQINSDKK